jgi:hypothetical protein
MSFRSTAANSDHGGREEMKMTKLRCKECDTDDANACACTEEELAKQGLLYLEVSTPEGLVLGFTTPKRLLAWNVRPLSGDERKAKR